MSDAWDDMKRTKEEEFFQRQNKDALKKMKDPHLEPVRLCPIDGQKMDRLSVSDIVVDRCPKCLGVWLDHGELGRILQITEKDTEQRVKGWLSGLVQRLSDR